MKIILLISLLSIYITNGLLAQPSIQWQKTYGGTGYEYAVQIIQTNDNNYIWLGLTQSNDYDISGAHGSSDFWIVKLNSSGEIKWSKTYGGSDVDWPYSIQQTSDGGYIIAGYTQSNDGDITSFHGNSDAWIIKLDGLGNMEWQRSIGGSLWDEAQFATETSDKGYIITGKSSSTDGDAAGNPGGNFDYWIIKLDHAGMIQWQKAYGGSLEDGARYVTQTEDGGYIVVGEANSNDGDISGNHGGADLWILKLDGAGNIQWSKCLGGCCFDSGQAIFATEDGYYISAQTTSNDGDVSNLHGALDAWVIKINVSFG